MMTMVTFKADEEWLVNFEGTAPLHDAIGKMQQKVKQLDFELKEAMRQQTNNSNDEHTMRSEEKEKYHYALRGKHDEKRSNHFFRRIGRS